MSIIDLTSARALRFDGVEIIEARCAGIKLWAKPVEWTPGNLGSALVGWWDAKNSASITQAATAVSAWADLSGSGNTLRQTTGAAQPVYSVTALNGLPGVIATSGRKLKSTTGINLPAASTPFSIMMVGCATTLPSSIGMLFGFGNNAAQGMPSLGLRSTGGAYFDHFNGGQVVAPSIYNIPRILFVEAAGTGTTRIYVDGVLFLSGNHVTSGITAAKTVNMFQWQASGFDQPGIIQESLITNSILSSGDRQKLEGYSAWRWGLQSNLDVSHPYKNAPPLATLENVDSEWRLAA